MIPTVLFAVAIYTMPTETWIPEPPPSIEITVDQLNDYLDVSAIHKCIAYGECESGLFPPAAPPHTHHVHTYGVERWRPLVEKYFRPEDVEWALNVMQCESGGDPYAANKHSSARGLFQHLGRYWPERSAKAGWAGYDIYDPEANIAVAAWLLDYAGKGSWTCKG